MEELFKLVALVDLSSPENLKAFEDWKANDGSKEGLLNIGEAIELMAEAEGLQAHKNAVTIRLKDLK